MEDELRARLAAGRYREAFEGILDCLGDRVFRLALAMMRNETVAEDVTQDVLVKVWKALPGYRGAASVATWVYAIARNTCLTELKRRAQRPCVSLEAPECRGVIESLPGMQAHDPEGGMALDAEALVAQLPEKYRRVVVLFYLEQKSYEEVAARLALPLGTVKTYLFRARRALLELGSRPSRCCRAAAGGDGPWP